jgi:Arm DNA-binding domain
MALQQQILLPFLSPTRPSTKAKARKIKFTQTKLEALRHRGGSPEYVYDQDKPGLAVRLTSGGARTFVFVGRLHGKVARITLGRIEALPLNKARSAIDKIRGDIALGLDVVAQRKSLRQVEAARTTLDQGVRPICSWQPPQAKNGTRLPQPVVSLRRWWTQQKGGGGYHGR